MLALGRVEDADCRGGAMRALTMKRDVTRVDETHQYTRACSVDVVPTMIGYVQ